MTNANPTGLDLNNRLHHDVVLAHSGFAMGRQTDAFLALTVETFTSLGPVDPDYNIDRLVAMARAEIARRETL